MLPDDVVAMMAKVIFVISAAMIMCMAKVKADEISAVNTPKIYYYYYNVLVK